MNWIAWICTQLTHQTDPTPILLVMNNKSFHSFSSLWRLIFAISAQLTFICFWWVDDAIIVLVKESYMLLKHGHVVMFMAPRTIYIFCIRCNHSSRQVWRRIHNKINEKKGNPFFLFFYFNNTQFVPAYMGCLWLWAKDI